MSDFERMRCYFVRGELDDADERHEELTKILGHCGFVAVATTHEQARQQLASALQGEQGDSGTLLGTADDATAASGVSHGTETEEVPEDKADGGEESGAAAGAAASGSSGATTAADAKAAAAAAAGTEEARSGAGGSCAPTAAAAAASGDACAAQVPHAGGDKDQDCRVCGGAEGALLPQPVQASVPEVSSRPEAAPGSAAASDCPSSSGDEAVAADRSRGSTDEAIAASRGSGNVAAGGSVTQAGPEATVVEQPAPPHHPYALRPRRRAAPAGHASHAVNAGCGTGGGVGKRVGARRTGAARGNAEGSIADSGSAATAAAGHRRARNAGRPRRHPQVPASAAAIDAGRQVRLKGLFPIDRELQALLSCSSLGGPPNALLRWSGIGGNDNGVGLALMPAVTAKLLQTGRKVPNIHQFRSAVDVRGQLLHFLKLVFLGEKLPERLYVVGLAALAGPCVLLRAMPQDNRALAGKTSSHFMLRLANPPATRAPDPGLSEAEAEGSPAVQGVLVAVSDPAVQDTLVRAMANAAAAYMAALEDEGEEEEQQRDPKSAALLAYLGVPEGGDEARLRLVFPRTAGGEGAALGDAGGAAAAGQGEGAEQEGPGEAELAAAAPAGWQVRQVRLRLGHRGGGLRAKML